MKKYLKYVSLLGVCAILSPIMSSCNSSQDTEDVVYVKVLNAGDYVYLNDPENGYNEKDLTEQYVDWINEPENKAKYFGEDFNKRVEIIYDTYDTNETMYNELKTGKSSYDLVCTSDYMIQRLAKAEMIQKIDMTSVENYKTYGSDFLIGENGKLNTTLIDPEDSSLGTLNDFTIGYMWGTLGLMFNPEFKRINGRESEDVINDFCAPDGWNTLREKSQYYANCASIKDSMRDTYAMGLVHTFSDEFEELYNAYDGNYSDEYNKKVSEIFNRHDDETIDKVQASLIDLKNYIYGFEVDTGKSDIVTGKVGINLCWSGDAVYSMDTAEENGTTLYFALPEYCCNIWFDGFCMPSAVTGDHKSGANSFLDFLSLPATAANNMDYVGYTPFIGGSDVFDIVTEWYDCRYDEDGNLDESVESYPYDLSYFFRNDDTDTSDYIVHVDPEQINRQMRAQYPMVSDLPHLAIMQDFGAQQNDKIVSMWENVKVNPLPIWVTIIVITAFVLIVGFLGSYKLINKAKIKKRKRIREE